MQDVRDLTTTAQIDHRPRHLLDEGSSTTREGPARQLALIPYTQAAPSCPPSDAFRSVAAFHRAFELPCQRLPSLAGVSDGLLLLRARLLSEEAAEFAEASSCRDLVGMADALADVVYVAYGSAITLGIDLDAVLREVHRSNMSKLNPEGRPVLRADGKVLKPSHYTPPAVGEVLARQLPLPL